MGVVDSQAGDPGLSDNKGVGESNHPHIFFTNKMWEESLRFYLFGGFFNT